MKILHFDNATASPLCLKAAEILRKSEDVSPFSPYGEKELKAINQAREELDTLFPVGDEGSLFFAPSRQAAADALYRYVFEEWGRGFGKNHFLTSQVDEAPAIFALSHLEGLGGRGTLIPVNTSGHVTKEALQAALTPRTSLMTLSLGNGLLGTVQPIDELYSLLDDRGVLLHLDLTHVLGKIDVEPLKLKADFLTFSLETLHGPRGAAFFWSKRPLKSGDLLFGSEPHAIGLLDVPRCLALAAAAKEGKEHLSSLQLEGSLLREQFEEKLLKALPECHILFKEAIRLPTSSVIAFPGVRTEALLYALNERGIRAAMGGGTYQMMGHLLTACKIPPELALSALNFTFSRLNTEEDIEEGVKRIQDAYTILRKLSTGLV